MIDKSRLIHVCRILNKNEIKYAVVGGYACAFHGHTRMTEDIDILLSDDEQNLRKTIDAIKQIFPNITDDISIDDIRENVVLKIIDDIEVDFSIKAWNIDFAEALEDICRITIEGVEIPYLGINALIKSKQTYREIDQWDTKILQELKKKKM